MKKIIDDFHNGSDEVSVTNSVLDTPFNFRSEWLQKLSKTVHNHTTSSYLQIESKIIQNMGYLMAYSGLARTAFYIMDFSRSGTGKTQNVTKCRDLLLQPVFDIQRDKHSSNLEKYKEELEKAKGKEKENVQRPKTQKCIHVQDTSPEALFEAFESTRAQIVEFGEIGDRLKKHDSLVNFIVSGHNTSTLHAPNYKNAVMSKEIDIDGISFFFYGDSNLTYLSERTFYDHLQGGLINRCLIIFSQYKRSFDELPQDYYVHYSDKHYFNDLAKDLMKFSKSCSGYSPVNSYIKNPLSVAFERKLYNKADKMEREGNIFFYLYHRAILNYRNILHIFHYLECFENKKFDEVVSDETIKEAIAFTQRIFEGYEALYDELNGVTKEEFKSKRHQQIIAQLYKHQDKFPMSIGDFTRLVKNSRVREIEPILREVAVLNGRQIVGIK